MFWGCVCFEPTNHTNNQEKPPKHHTKQNKTKQPNEAAPGKPLPERLRVLDADGLARPGESIRPGDVYVNLQRPLNTRDPVTLGGRSSDASFRPAPLSYKGVAGERCVVDKVQVTSEFFCLLVCVIV